MSVLYPPSLKTAPIALDNTFFVSVCSSLILCGFSNILCYFTMVRMGSNQIYLIILTLKDDDDEKVFVVLRTIVTGRFHH